MTLESIDLIRKFEFDPPTYEDGKAPEELLRSKAAAARRSTRRVDFDDDSDGIDHDSEQDRGEYGPDAATARKPDGERKKLKRRKRARTPVELDEDEKDRRAEARRKKEIEKQTKVMLSTMFIHDSDDEDWDADKDATFFAREQALRDEAMTAFQKAMTLGSTEPASSKKRKADEPAKKSKRRKSPPKRNAPFDDSDDEPDEEMEDAVSINSRASSRSSRRYLGRWKRRRGYHRHSTVISARRYRSCERRTKSTKITYYHYEGPGRYNG
ncbi:Topoisomerase 1-associated factor 1 [Neocucurbitaria cava]|uniref:Topoisomerase 1-associated factor 1 n=1 Tax=Neocucurbitaria cava TaxID=798079 RepID=A0A9W8YKA5_9PLEO|nr:Topoisomerase 1-associated factor 1 [Neocucurbitaria cava]